MPFLNSQPINAHISTGQISNAPHSAALEDPRPKTENWKITRNAETDAMDQREKELSFVAIDMQSMEQSTLHRQF